MGSQVDEGRMVMMRTIKEERLARDLDTMVNIVNNDRQHIERAKAKRERVFAEAVKEEKVFEPENAFLKVVAGFSTWALALVCLL